MSTFDDELYKSVAQLQATDDPQVKLYIVEQLQEQCEDYRSELLQDLGMEFPIWHHTVEYQIINDTLFYYWLVEKAEFRVRVKMDFIKANGEIQEKVITWQNPEYTCEADWSGRRIDFWTTGTIYKRNREDE